MSIKKKIDNNGIVDLRIIALFKNYELAQNYQQYYPSIFTIYQGKHYCIVYADLEDLIEIGMANRKEFFDRKSGIITTYDVCIFPRLQEKHLLEL